MDPKTEGGTQSLPGANQGSSKLPVSRSGGAGDREYAQVEQRFNTNPRPFTVEHKEILNPIMFATKDLATAVIEKIPNNRERALAITHLQEFTWACEKGLLNSSTN